MTEEERKEAVAKALSPTGDARPEGPLRSDFFSASPEEKGEGLNLIQFNNPFNKEQFAQRMVDRAAAGYTDRLPVVVESPLFDAVAAQRWVPGVQKDILDARMRSGQSFSEAVGLGQTPDLTIDGSRLREVLDEYQLPDRYADFLLQARSEEDLIALANAAGTRVKRERDLMNTTGIGNAIAKFGLEMLDPTFVAAGFGTGTAFRVGQSTTRLGNAVRGTLAGVTADVPLEGFRMNNDPDVGEAEFAFAVIASGLFSGALGSLGRQLNSEEVKQIEEQLVELNGIISGNSSVGAAQLNPIMRVNDDGTVDIDAPEQKQLRLTSPSTWANWGAPIDKLQRSSSPTVRALAGRLTWLPTADGVQRGSAFEHQRRIHESSYGYARNYMQRMKDFYRDQGQLAVSGGVSTAQRQEFSRAVWRHINGVEVSENPAILQAAEELSNLQLQSLAYAQDRTYLGGNLDQAREINATVQQRLDAEEKAKEDAAEVIKARANQSKQPTKAADDESSQLSLQPAEWPDTPEARTLIGEAIDELGMSSRNAFKQARNGNANALKMLEQSLDAALRRRGGGVDGGTTELDGLLREWRDATSGSRSDAVLSTELTRIDELEARMPEEALLQSMTKAQINDEWETLFGNRLPKSMKKADMISRFKGEIADLRRTARKQADSSKADFMGSSQGDRVELTPEQIIDFAERADEIAIRMINSSTNPNVFKQDGGRWSRRDWPEAPAAPEAPKAPEAPAAPPPDLPDYNGVEAFQRIVHDPNYIQRRFSPEGIRNLIQKHGEDRVVLKIAGAIARGNPDRFGEKFAKAERVAKSYFDTVKQVYLFNSDGPRFAKKTFQDRQEALKDVRESLGIPEGKKLDDVTEEALELLLEDLAPIQKAVSASNRAKPRISLDLTGKHAGDLIEMFDQDALGLALDYSRHISGHAALSRAGFSSDAELNRLIDQADQELSFGQNADNDKLAIEELRFMRDAIMGIPSEELAKHPRAAFLANQLRRYNFAAYMSNVSFAAVSEVAGIMTRMGPVRLLQSSPEVWGYFKRARAGDLTAADDIYKTSDQVLGHGTSMLRAELAQRTERYDFDFEDADNPFSGKVGKAAEAIDTFTRKSANGVARWSGMQPLTQFMRMSYVTAFAQDLVKKANAGARPLSRRRMASMGIDDEMWDRIAVELRNTGTTRSPDTGRELPLINHTEWTDKEAAEAFINMIDRDSRRMVMEGDLGHTPRFLREAPLTSLLFQFLSFPINAWTKHTRYAGNVRDGRAFAEVMAMALGGMLGVTSRSFLQGASIEDPQRRKQFFEERLNPLEMAKGAIYYSAHASLLPNAYDSVLSFARTMTGDEILPQELSFGWSRNSGLAGNFLTGNPTVAGADRIYNAPGKFFKGETGSKQDFQNIQRTLPFGNHVAAIAVSEWLLQDTPEEEVQER